MLLTLVAALAAVPISDSPHVVAVSIFKNGYSFVVREMPVHGRGEVVIGELPQASLGTYWISASSGVKLSSVIRSSEPVESSRDAANLEEIIAANTGRSVRLGIYATDSILGKEVTGKLLSGAGDSLVILTDKGAMAFRKSLVTSISSVGGELLYKVPVASLKDILKVNIESGSSGTLTTIGLERGISWTPAYAIDISDPKLLTLTAKSTVANDLTNLLDVDVRFVTGFPNLPWSEIIEPLLSPATSSNFGMEVDGRGRSSNLGAQMQNAAAAPARDFEQAFSPNSVGGVQAEDLFFYKEPHVSLHKFDRAYYILFGSKAEYSHLYTLDLDDLVANNVEYRPIGNNLLDVWHTLKFKNTAGQPLTTAPATVFKDGEIVGQDTLEYSSAGQDVLLNIAKALDIHAAQREEEVARERNSLKDNNSNYDLITLKGTIEIQNSRPEAVKMRIDKELTGEVVSTTENPVVRKIAKGLIQVNPRAKVEWSPTISGGGTRVLTYTYKLYVRT